MAGAIRILTAAALCAGAVLSSMGEKPADGQHWSFQAVRRPKVPLAGDAIDAFVQTRLAETGLTQNPPATARELIRRASFDLIGLPPRPEEAAAFEQDDSPGAFERVIDRLLASPQYGERWGRHWLDVVRFAQSNGYERDGEKLLAWRYRDYVIRSFNQDKPYDRFVLEQIAGDELPDGTAETVVATAFQRLGVYDDEPDDKRMADFDALDDVVSTTGAAFLGLTLGCARCHDHKFDPIPQSDYYSLLAFFRGVRPFDSGAPGVDSPGFAPLAGPDEVRHWRAWRAARLKTLEEERAAARDERRQKELDARIKAVRDEVPYEYTLAVRENGRECPATHVLARGNAASPGREVSPAFPRCLTMDAPKLPEAPADAVTSGRRRVLGDWIASGQNPLTARVIVNRVWQHHFGEGLVKTTSDFGRAGSPPSHPELLDWLAADFVDQGWSLKKLHKRIMLSATYRQSSRADNERALAADPGNRLLWRQNMRRLEAEALRDSVLAVSGRLDSQMAGRGFFPHLAGEVLAGQSRPGLDWDVSAESEQCRRSVYAFVRRTMGVPLFEAFDYSNTTSPLPERPVTTVAPQALMLLNDHFMQQQAAAFAVRIWREEPGNAIARVRRAYAMALNREPSKTELGRAEAFLSRNKQAFDALAGRNSFALDVPNALSTEYFGKLAANQFLRGPQKDWSYYRGVWAPPYEGIRVAQRDQAPFALWQGGSFTNGTFEANVILASSTEFASLLFRAREDKEAARGYELVFAPRSKRVQWRRQEEKSEILAEAAAELPIGKALEVKVALADLEAGVRAEVFLPGKEQPILAVTDPRRIAGGGAFGVRTWGGPLTVENVRWRTRMGGGESAVRAETVKSEQRAFEAFCLVLLNLNELVYVD